MSSLSSVPLKISSFQLLPQASGLLVPTALTSFPSFRCSEHKDHPTPILIPLPQPGALPAPPSQLVGLHYQCGSRDNGCLLKKGPLQPC